MRCISEAVCFDGELQPSVPEKLSLQSGAPAKLVCVKLAPHVTKRSAAQTRKSALRPADMSSFPRGADMTRNHAIHWRRM